MRDFVSQAKTAGLSLNELVFMPSTKILIIQIQIGWILPPFTNFVMADVASRLVRGLVFGIVHTGLLTIARSYVQYAVVPRFTELHQPSALIRVRNRSVSSWHGMHTASVKDKHFLK